MPCLPHRLVHSIGSVMACGVSYLFIWQVTTDELGDLGQLICQMETILV